MSEQQQLLGGATGRTDTPEVLAAYEVDYTPIAVAVQQVIALVAAFNDQTPRRILDPSAGSGAWPRAVRAVLGEVHITGVERRGSERANVDAACDETHISLCSDFLKRASEAIRAGALLQYDWVITNPPFTAFEACWPLEFLRAGILHADSIVALYGLSQWGQSDGAQTMLRAWSPMLQLRVGGRVAHRGDGKADAREYSLWVWSCADGRQRRERQPSWRTVQLPMLTTAQRRWAPDDVPGCRPIDQALVQQLRGGL